MVKILDAVMLNTAKIMKKIEISVNIFAIIGDFQYFYKEKNDNVLDMLFSFSDKMWLHLDRHINS